MIIFPLGAVYDIQVIGLTSSANLPDMLEKRIMSRLNAQFVYLLRDRPEDICDFLGFKLTLMPPSKIHTSAYSVASDNKTDLDSGGAMGTSTPEDDGYYFIRGTAKRRKNSSQGLAIDEELMAYLIEFNKQVFNAFGNCRRFSLVSSSSHNIKKDNSNSSSKKGVPIRSPQSGVKMRKLESAEKMLLNLGESYWFPVLILIISS